MTRAAVLYVFRTLVDDDIPMNEGCLKPIDIVLPEGSIVCCRYPAAVCAGNVETSQWVTDTLYGALGVLAAAQGTMNNFTFGNASYQYYETICGGSGAGPDFDGTAARAHPHDQLAPDRPRGAGVALSRSCWRATASIAARAARAGTRAATARSGGCASSSRCRRRWSRTTARCRRSGCTAASPARCGDQWIERADGTARSWRAGAGREVGSRRRVRRADAERRGYGRMKVP